MEHDTLIRQHDLFVQLAQELVSASEALATSMAGDEAAIPMPTAYELLTNLMDTLMAVSRAKEGLRGRLVASLYSTEDILTGVALDTGETSEMTQSVLAADAAILHSGISIELAERCLSGARNAISGQMHKSLSGNLTPRGRNTTNG